MSVLREGMLPVNSLECRYLNKKNIEKIRQLLNSTINHSYRSVREVSASREGMLPVNWLLLRYLNKKKIKNQIIVEFSSSQNRDKK